MRRKSRSISPKRRRSRSPTPRRRKSRSPTPRRRKSRSPTPRRRKSRSPVLKRYKRQRSRSSSLSPIRKSSTSSLGLLEQKNASEKLRKEEEEEKKRRQQEAELKLLEEETSKRVEEAIRTKVEESLNSVEIRVEIQRQLEEGRKKLLTEVAALLEKEKEAALIEARNKEEQARKEKEELEGMLEENRRRVEEAQRREALEQQRREEERYRELEELQRQKEEALRRKKQEEEEARNVHPKPTHGEILQGVVFLSYEVCSFSLLQSCNTESPSFLCPCDASCGQAKAFMESNPFPHTLQRLSSPEPSTFQHENWQDLLGKERKGKEGNWVETERAKQQCGELILTVASIKPNLGGLESREILKEGAVKHLRTGGGVIAVEPPGEVQSDMIPVTAPDLALLKLGK
ncbi:unnamed protein product [Prunus armeniaca]